MALLVPDVGEVELLKRLLCGRGGAITSASNANPSVITTTAAHGLTTNDRVTINDVATNTNANTTAVVTVTGGSTFTIVVASNGAGTGGIWCLADMEDWTLKLRTDGVTPAESDVAGTYTEATFTSYVTKTLTAQFAATKWPIPTTAAGVTSSTYGTTLSWSPGSSQTVTGYFVVGATTGTLLFAENFGSSKALSSGDTFNLTIKFQLD